MQDRPSAAELLATIDEYFQAEVLPNVSGTLRYHTLVASNLVRILAREAEQYPAALVAERTQLCELLGVPPEGEAAAQVAVLNDRLAEALRSGQGDETFERAALEVLTGTTLAKLAINKPGYDSYDMAVEVETP